MNKNRYLPISESVFVQGRSINRDTLKKGWFTVKIKVLDYKNFVTGLKKVEINSY